jgi:hypothetical protein
MVLKRFFASGDESNYSASYGLPCVDSHNLIFSIDNNTNWTRILSLDMRTPHIYSITKSGGTWGTWVTFLDSENCNNYAPTKTGGGASGTWNINIVGNANITAGMTWPAPQNITCTATANGHEWSFDLNAGSYTGTYWHVWSAKNSASIL